MNEVPSDCSVHRRWSVSALHLYDWPRSSSIKYGIRVSLGMVEQRSRLIISHEPLPPFTEIQCHSSKTKKGASLAHFYPPPDKHNPSQPFTQISSFQKIFTSQSSLRLILYLADKPHFIPTQQQSERNTACVEIQAVHR